MVGQTAFTEDRRIDFGLARRSVVSYGEHARYGLRSRDILVSRVFATLDGVGQPALVGEPPEPAVYESNMMRLRVDTSVAIPEFVFYSLLAKGARKHITKNVKLSNQASVSQSGLSSIPIGLPSLEEQERICAVLESIAIRGRAEKALLAARRLARDGLASDLLTGRVRLGIPE